MSRLGWFLVFGLVACSGDGDEATDDTAQESTTSETTPVTGDVDCVAACENIDSCGDDVYAVVDTYDDLAGCIDQCEGELDEYGAEGCEQEHRDIQACIATSSCSDVVSFATDPASSGVCPAELGALGACLSG